MAAALSQITGLRFIAAGEAKARDWLTRRLVSGSREEFVLNPNDRIAFDLVAPVNESVQDFLWIVYLAPGVYDVRYVFEVPPGEARYDYLGKGSRFADITPPWVGVVESNMVQVQV